MPFEIGQVRAIFINVKKTGNKKVYNTKTTDAIAMTQSNFNILNGVLYYIEQESGTTSHD